MPVFRVYKFLQTHSPRSPVGLDHGVLAGAILLAITLAMPVENGTLFMLLLAITALFAAPNVVSTVYDVPLPEVRSIAMSLAYFIESAGSALAPLIAGMIAEYSTFRNAFLIICIST